MKTKGIEHIALTVPDVEAATVFFNKHLMRLSCMMGIAPATQPYKANLPKPYLVCPKVANGHIAVY